MRVFAALCIALLPLLAWPAERLLLVSDEWCPYACKPDSDHPGYMVELARAVFEPLGYRVEYLLMPFTRAEQEVVAGRADGFVGVLKLPKRAKHAFPSETQGLARVCFYTRQDDAWRYAGPASLKGRRIGVVSGYSYGDEVDGALKQAGSAVDAVSGNTGLRQNLVKLKPDRIDTVVEYDAVLAWTTSDAVSAAPRAAGCAAAADALYIAFSPALPHSPELAKRLSDGTAAMRKDGRLDAILARYGLKDWR